MTDELKSEIDVGTFKKKRGRPPGTKNRKKVRREEKGGEIVTSCCTPTNMTTLQAAKLRTGLSYSKLINHAIEFADEKGMFEKLSVKVPAAVAKAQAIIAAYERKIRDVSH